jgi:hypothetical protein
MAPERLKNKTMSYSEDAQEMLEAIGIITSLLPHPPPPFVTLRGVSLARETRHDACVCVYVSVSVSVSVCVYVCDHSQEFRQE